MIDPVDADTLALPVTVPQTTRLRFASGPLTYTVVLTPDLFGDWLVMQSWDGKCNQRGGGRVRHVENYDAGLMMMRRIAHQREKQGYLQIG